MASLFHTFWWLIADGDRNRPNKPFQTREGFARSQLAAGLHREGYEDGRDLLNSPPPSGRPPTELAHIDTSWSRPKDLCMTMTRIPLSDHLEGKRKKIPRGFTDLEAEIMAEWALYVPYCSRLMVQIHDRLHALLPEGKENLARIAVYERSCAPYNRLARCDGSPARKYLGQELRSPVFLLKIPKMQERNMGYFGIWGLDGNTTLIWATLLRFRLPELLARDHFVMAELQGGTVPDRPLDLDFAADWRAEILIDEPIKRGPRNGPRASVPTGISVVA